MYNAPKRDLGAMVACVILIGVGIAAIFATSDYSSLGSVFPRTIAGLMAFFSALYLVLAWLKPGPKREQEGGSRGRQAAVAVVMLIWAFTFAKVGFLLSSVIAFVLLLAIAHYGSWTARITMIYGAAATLVIGGLYTLFKVVLQVPLPSGVFL